MKYNREIGKIYDTIFFLIEYFNPKDIENKYINIFDNTSFMLECYQQVKSEIIDIPDFLAPLFYYNNDDTSPISMFFSEQIDFQKDNIDSFIVKITTQAEYLYKITRQFIFGENSDSISSGYINALQVLNVPIEYKLQISMLFGNFSYAITVLAQLLKQIYISIDKLHQKYEKELLSRFNQIQSDSNLQLYQNMLKYSRSEIDITTITICLMNQYIVFGPSRKSNSTFIMLGYRHEEAMDTYLEDSSIDLDTFIITCGNDTRLKMLRAIVEHGELTSSQIAQILDYPVTTTIRHINMLSNNNLIYIARRDGLQIFYKINTRLFKKMQISVNELFDNIISKN